MDYTPVICITQRERSSLPKTRGGLTPYLKKGGCAAVLLTELLHKGVINGVSAHDLVLLIGAVSRAFELRTLSGSPLR